ncbi:MAG: lipoprotein [Methylococcaceae bacterium]|nr:lipoprotein [Methylococcaceae bacterium]
MKTNNIVLTISVLLLLQACGQTGPLYMPDSPPPIYVPKQ